MAWLSSMTHDLKMVHGWAFPACDEFMAAEMKADGSYQQSHLRAALAFVTNGACCIDAGAHVGTWSRLLSVRFARVIAVEPSPDTCEALRINMAAFSCANVEIREVALGKAAGFVSIAPLDPKAEALHNTGARFMQAGGTIPVERIDDWDLPSCGFIKLDIEGGECDALAGAAATLTRCRPIVLYEQKGFGRRYGHAKDGTEVLLRSLGYRHFADAGCDRIYGPKK